VEGWPATEAGLQERGVRKQANSLCVHFPIVDLRITRTAIVP
jgi:hypothetical protein